MVSYHFVCPWDVLLPPEGVPFSQAVYWMNDDPYVSAHPIGNTPWHTDVKLIFVNFEV